MLCSNTIANAIVLTKIKYSKIYLRSYICADTIRAMNGKEVIAMLEASGWVLERITGSHHIMEKDGKAVPVPVHGKKDIKPGLLASIARQSGVKLKKK